MRNFAQRKTLLRGPRFHPVSTCRHPSVADVKEVLASSAGVLPCVKRTRTPLHNSSQFSSPFLTLSPALASAQTPSAIPAFFRLQSVHRRLLLEGERFGDHGDENLQASRCSASSASRCLHHASGGAGDRGRSWAWRRRHCRRCPTV